MIRNGKLEHGLHLYNYSYRVSEAIENLNDNTVVTNLERRSDDVFTK